MCWCLCWNFISSFFLGGLVSKLPPFSRIPKNTISFKFRKQPKWKIFYSIEQKASKHEVELICSNFFSGIWFFWQESFSPSSVHWTIFDAAAKTISNFYIKVFLQRDEKYWFLIKMQLYGSLGPSGRALDCKYKGPGFISPIFRTIFLILSYKNTKNGANLRQINQGHVLSRSP